MGPAYLFALIVGLGILLVQSIMGSKEAHAEAHGELEADADADAELDADGELDADADGELDAHAEGDFHHDVAHDVGGGGKDFSKDFSKDLGKDVGDHGGKELSAIGGLAAMLLSTRFWIFAFLGFGLSGTLLHYLFGTLSGVATFATAMVAGIVSGLAASLTFRALRSTSSKTAANTTSAVGKVARVLVPCSSGGIGQVRILLDGQTVDLPAKTNELRIERGDTVVIEEVEGDVAQVSKAPPELRS